MRKLFTITTALMATGLWTARAADPPQNVTQWIEALGGEVVRASDGAIVEVSLARTWATDYDIERVAEIASLKRLDLSFTYVTDRGIERLQQLQELEELNLDTAEFITDAATSYLRANRRLRRLSLRGTDVTDISLPYLAKLTALKSLDLSHTMLGDVGIESLPALAELEDLHLGATRITGINLNFLKLLPKLKKLNFNGIQRRNGGLCWSPLLTDLDLDTIAMLSDLEELSLGMGLGLGKLGSRGRGESACRLGGGIKVTDLGLAKLAKLKKLRLLDISGAQITPTGLKVLESLPRLERLNLWNCKNMNDSAAPVLAAIPSLTYLDLSQTSVGDATLQSLGSLPRLKSLYLTDTNVTPAAVEAFRKGKQTSFVSWVRRPVAPKSDSK